MHMCSGVLCVCALVALVAAQTVYIEETSEQYGHYMTPLPSPAIMDAPLETDWVDIHLNTTDTYHEIVGFGGAFT
ncbi:hypothetical protein KIPB_014904, partial [Kipferlia bialata]|eukprot:g14904.t1